MPRSIPLLVIAGPTATGKTGAAIRVARSVGGEIISADSMQIYRKLDVGTAKPSPEELRTARFHLVDFVEPDRPYTVADFQADARRAIAECWGRGNLPILCGGTGLYVRAILEHFDFPPAEPARRARVRAELDDQTARLGVPAMHGKLGKIDPEAAARISPSDTRRIVRALEVFELTGQTMTARQRVDDAPAVKYNPLYYALTRPRQDLYAGIEGRVDRMMGAGWLDEVRRIHAQGYSPALQCLQAIGYRHLLAWFRQDTGDDGALDQVIQTIKRDTRRFAKRQLTWFRRDNDVRWMQWASPEQFHTAVRELCRQGRRLADCSV